MDDIRIGDRVHYQPAHFPKDEWENGIVKSIAKHNPGHVFVVYSCGDDWENYKNFTAAATNVIDLHRGWKT